MILIGNNLINTIIPVLTTSIALRTFGHNNLVLSIATGIVAFLIIVFAEIAPKIVGATYPEKIALPASLILAPLMRVARPLVWFVNLFANAMLRLLHINTKGGRDQRLSTEELRTIVLESGSFMPTKHRSILLNLFDLENITVDDVMIPRRRIEALDFDAPFEQILHQLETCYHNKLIVYQGDIDRVLGVLHVRKTLVRAAQPGTRARDAARTARRAVFRSEQARPCSSSCNTSRRAVTAWRSSSTNTANCRGSSRRKTSSRN